MKRTLVVLAMPVLLAHAQGCSDVYETGGPERASAETSGGIGHHASPIVGGIADPNHRYVVSLGGCTGTVVSKYTVLTAGHCFGSIASVGFGPTVAGATTISVASKVRDPLYADICDQDATYDLTVVKLSQPAPTQAAPLLRATLNNTSKYVGPSWVWVGFGRTGSSGGTGTKRVTTFPIDLVGPATGRGSLCEIPETLVYATARGRNTCNGDSGGPSFWVGGGVEYLAGVTSSGDANCTIDATQQRSDQPYLDHFIQAQIDANEGNDPCRSNGVCDETCHSNGQLGDPDCAANHCHADGICAEACVAPRDPDCAPLDSNNCGDNGVCDLTCATDPDCTRDCAAEGNCIPNCPVPDPDCAPQGDAGVPDATTDAGRGDAGPPDAASPDTGNPDGGPSDAGTADAATPDAHPPDAATPDVGRTPDAAPPRDGGPTFDATTTADTATPRDATTMSDAVASDAIGSDAMAGDAAVADTGSPSEGGRPVDPGSGVRSDSTAGDSGCSCRSAPSSRGDGLSAALVVLALAVIHLRRRGRGVNG